MQLNGRKLMKYWKQIIALFEQVMQNHYWEKTEQKLDGFAAWLTKNKISPNLITLVGVVFAGLGLNFLAMEAYFSALICLLFNRLCDILDGICARQKRVTPFGAFFDVFADYTSYSLFVFGFVLADTGNNGAAGAFLLVALLVSVAALLGLAITSEKSFKELNASKVNVRVWGTVQNADSSVALILMCLLPTFFMQFAILFGLLLSGKALLLLSSAYYNLEILKSNKK